MIGSSVLGNAVTALSRKIEIKHRSISCALIYLKCLGQARHEAAPQRHEAASLEASGDHEVERKT
jgi:hypothetical protein